MFGLIKSIIWIVGFVVVSMFVLDYLGYKVNTNYFNESKAKCLEQLNDCKNEYIKQGTENAKCDFDCVDPKLIIQKNTETSTSEENASQDDILEEGI
jgi:hypothetical protein